MAPSGVVEAVIVFSHREGGWDARRVLVCLPFLCSLQIGFLVLDVRERPFDGERVGSSSALTNDRCDAQLASRSRATQFD